MEDESESEDDDEDYLSESEASELVSMFFHDTYRPRCSKILASRFCNKGPSMKEAKGLT
jgi:hypothetical protein